MVSHEIGPLKQRNKKHKGEKKRNDNGSQALRLRLFKKDKSLNKKQRRLFAKQKRLHKTRELKTFAKLRGTKEETIMCLLLPLTPNIPTHLAQVLLQSCDPSMHKLDLLGKHTLQNIVHVHSKSLKKSFSFVCAQFDDIFGCLDLCQVADWIIILAPSDDSLIDTSYELLTAIYAQGFTNITYAVLSSINNMKELKRNLEIRFPIPESTIYQLNSTNNALNLVRHIALTHPSAIVHSAALYRSYMLVDYLTMFCEDSINDEPKTASLHLCGRLRGSPLFLLDKFGSSSVDPSMHFTGWGDFPLTEVKWITSDSIQHTWFRSSSKNDLNDQSRDFPDDIVMSSNESSENDSDSDSKIIESDENSANSVSCLSSTEMNLKNNKLPYDAGFLNDSVIDTDSLISHALRTTTTTATTAFSAAKLATFREARTEELFPDEVETPIDQSARERFARYRGLPRFHGSVWPIESDNLPLEYNNIAFFKNYHLNRRTMVRYLRKRLEDFQKSGDSDKNVNEFIPSGVDVEFIFKGIPEETASLIMFYHNFSDSENIPKLTDSRPHPLVIWSLLPYESKISVCHFTMHRVFSAANSISDINIVANTANKIAESNLNKSDVNSTLQLGEDASTDIQREDLEIRNALIKHQQIIDKRHRLTGSNQNNQNDPYIYPAAEPIQSKELMLFQAGIRRFITSPIYSTVTNSSKEKGKYEKFFSAIQSSVNASVYAPVMYGSVNVLQFRIRVTERENRNVSPYIGELVATGSLKSVDPNSLIIKRIYLSGHPFKINKHSVVVRYMFFNPLDIEYFKTIQVVTKRGAIGHINEPVGTHGVMKCTFNRPLNSSDIVLMPLYKRIFPKFVYGPQVQKLLKEQKQFNVLIGEKQCFVASDVIQLRKKTVFNSYTKPQQEIMDQDEVDLFNI